MSLNMVWYSFSGKTFLLPKPRLGAPYGNPLPEQAVLTLICIDYPVGDCLCLISHRTASPVRKRQNTQLSALHIIAFNEYVFCKYIFKDLITFQKFLKCFEIHQQQRMVAKLVLITPSSVVYWKEYMHAFSSQNYD